MYNLDKYFTAHYSNEYEHYFKFVSTCPFQNLLDYRFELVAEKKRCDGSLDNKGSLATVDECAMKCLNAASMFVYGIEGMDACNYKGHCVCYCATDASEDGTCEQKDLGNSRLYRFIREGDISLAYNCMFMTIRNCDSIHFLFNPTSHG